MGDSVVLFTKSQAMAAGGSAGVVTPTDLRNPFKGPMVVEEIRFMCDNKGIANLVNYNNQNVASGAGFVSAELTLTTNVRFSNGLVPLWLYGPQLSRETTENYSLQDNFTWVLPRPLVIPEQEAIIPQFAVSSLATLWPASAKTTVYVAIVGHKAEPEEIPDPGGAVYLPWISSWVGANQVGAAQYVEKTNPNQLVNPNKEPLCLDSFTGRIQVTDSTNYAGNVEALQDPGTLAAENPYVTLQLYAQGMLPIVKDRIPFGHLFQKQHRGWLARGVVKPKNYYIATLQENYSKYGAGLSFQAQIAMIGYRAVQRWW